MKALNSNHLIGPVLIIVCLFFLTGPPAATAHPLGEVVQETQVWHRGDHLLVAYKTTIGPSISASLQPDRNRDGKISGAEEEALLQRIVDTITPNLAVKIDRKPVKPAYYGGVIELFKNQAFVKGISAHLQYTLPLDHLPKGPHRFWISDHNFLAGELSSLTYYLPLAGRVADLKILDGGRSFSFRFWPGEMLVNKSGSQTGPVPVPSPQTPPPGPEEGRELADILQSPDLGLKTMLIGLALAFGLGAVHALSPGHGKAMVAAYLVGSRGSIKHAVLLGGVVTFTHVISVIVLGLITLFLSQYIVPHRLYPWLGVVSGALVAGIGYWMLARRALIKKPPVDQGRGREQVHEHSHDHTHPHNHPHTHGHAHPHAPGPEQRLSLGNLISLGVAGGMVPCPTALVVLLVAVALNRIGFGMAMILVFSLGLAAVLIVIGILTVSASKLLEGFSETRRWVMNLPVISAGLVMLAGLAIAFNSLYSSGVIELRW